MSPSTIEWTDETWNPTVGCSRVSPGCTHCYAIGVAHRAMQPAHAGLTERTERGIDWTGEVRCLPERLEVPLRWRRPRRVFVDSMSDLFHPSIPAEFIADVWDVMARCPQHIFQILTKRPQRAVAAVPWRLDGRNPLPNVWVGTSIESDRYAFRADHVRSTPAAVRFLSLEPLLGPVPSLDLDRIDWVIVGGESGPGARPMHVGWVRDIRDRCFRAEIPFLFKQWGAWAWPASPSDHILTIDGRLLEPGTRLGMDHMMRPTFVRRVGKHAAGRELEGRTWDEFPEGDLT